MVALDGRRMEVLKAANRVFSDQDLDTLEPSS